MIAVVLGTEDDVRGFAFAGARGYVCATAGEAAAAATAVQGRPDVALVLVSREVARLAPLEIARLEALDGPPAVVVLPGGGG